MLSYEKQSSGVYALTHTYVPPEFRGKGVAHQLGKKAMNWIRDNNYKAILVCEYLLQTFYPKVEKEYSKYVIH